MPVLKIAALKFVAASLVALAGSGALYQYVGTKLDEQKYPPIGRMVDIGGYKLHMIDKGVGGPIVVMDSAFGCNSLDWFLVQPEIAKFTRVITFDRAGYAWSDASPLARTRENIVEELHAMLHNADIQGPYILVGHSFGGIDVRVYANKYPDEVAAVVLVEGANEDMFGKLSMDDASGIAELKKKLYTTYFGIPRLMNNIPSEQQMYYAQQITTKFNDAMLQESLLLDEGYRQLKQDPIFLGDKPLTVISAGKPEMIYDASQNSLTRDQVDNFNKVMQECQADLVTKSSRGKQIIAEESGHMVNFEQPEIIVEAVREMIDELQKKD